MGGPVHGEGTHAQGYKRLSCWAREVVGGGRVGGFRVPQHMLLRGTPMTSRRGSLPREGGGGGGLERGPCTNASPHPPDEGVGCRSPQSAAGLP